MSRTGSLPELLRVFGKNGLVKIGLLKLAMKNDE